MPISKSVTAPNGSPVNYHRVTRLTSDFEVGVILVDVRSYTSEAVYIANQGHSWNWSLSLAVDSTSIPNIEQALLVATASPFVGGTAIPDASNTLDSVKTRRWAYVKEKRSVAEFGTFAVGTLTYDCDAVSTQKITSAVVLAMLSLQSNSAFSIDWTLSDNTTTTLTAQGMVGVGAALGQNVEVVYGKARSLRAAISAATTIDAVNSITW